MPKDVWPGRPWRLLWIVAAVCVLSNVAVERTPGSARAAEPFLPPIVEVTPVSADFRAEVDAAISSIPAGVWRTIRDAAWQIRIARFVTDAAPQLRDVSPRGWPAGSGWDNVDGANVPELRSLVFAEQRRDRRGQLHNARRVAGVVRHETGHALDLAARQCGTLSSAHPAFVAAYNQDSAAMGDQLRRHLTYYLQPRAAGRQETFAEAFAIVLGGGSDESLRPQFVRAFPAVMQTMRRFIDHQLGGTPTRTTRHPGRASLLASPSGQPLQRREQLIQRQPNTGH